MRYSKYHGLGNDYIVIDPKEIPNGELSSDQIIRICHRNYGIGSDGILLGPFLNDECDFGLRILNPDGSEAEKAAMDFEYSLDTCGITKKLEIFLSQYSQLEGKLKPKFLKTEKS